MSNQSSASLVNNGDEIVDRIYHEDMLLADRNAGYMSVNAFLFLGYVTALALIRTHGPVLSIIQFSVILLGIFLGIFHIAIGKRTEFAIEFIRSVERAGKLKFKDRYLFQFYREGRTFIDGDTIITSKLGNRWKRGRQGTMYNSIPWRWKFVGSVNNVVGVIIPLGILFFWVVLSFTIQTGLIPIDIYGITFPTNLVIGLLLLVIVTIFLTLMFKSWPNEPQEFSVNDTILAVMGRGIQFKDGSWTLTPDIETYRLVNGKPEHSPVLINSNKSGTVELIGGGSLNVDAASLFQKRINLLTVTGFAPPADYLKKWNGKDDGPSEGEIMAEKLLRLVPASKVVTWDQGKIGYNENEKSNTELEIKNIINYAKSNGFNKILFLTVSVHSKRVELIASKYEGITFNVINSDELLEMLDPKTKNRIKNLRGSTAYKKTIKYEKIGIRKLKRNK